MDKYVNLALNYRRRKHGEWRLSWKNNTGGCCFVLKIQTVSLVSAKPNTE